jgi:shikimate dehydrogenase
MAAPKAFVVGHPIAHSRSPLIHGHWLNRYRLPGSYERVDVSPEGISNFLRGLRQEGFVGGNVTIPHKEAAFRFADEATDRARRLGAANTLWLEGERLVADNTDVLGFIADLDQRFGRAWPETVSTAMAIGAGGAARAIAAGLLDRGVERILVANRTLARADEIQALDRQRVRAIGWAEIESQLRDSQLLVNTTSLGMTGQPPLDLDLSNLRHEAIVCDIVYVPLETALLAAARARGLRTVDGVGMRLHHAVPGFARWFGVTPEVTPELRALVAADIEGRA